MYVGCIVVRPCQLLPIFFLQEGKILGACLHTLGLLLSSLAIAACGVEVVSDASSGSTAEHEGHARSRHYDLGRR